MSDWKKKSIPIPKELATSENVPVANDWKSRGIPIKPEVSGFESFLRGGAQGATLGYSDEGVGLLEGFYNTITNKDPTKDFGQNYETARDESRVANELAKAANPKTYLGGELAGGVGSMLIPAGALLKGGGLAAKGTSVLGKAAPLAKTSALSGIAGTGYSDADTPLGVAVSGVGGAGLGALGYGGGKVLGNVSGKVSNALARKIMSKMQKEVSNIVPMSQTVPSGGVSNQVLKEAVDVDPTALDIPAYLTGKLSNKFKNLAERKATKAVTGNQARYYDPLVRRNKVQERGRTLLDLGVVKSGQNATAIRNNIVDEIDTVGKQLGDIVDEVDRIAPGSANGKTIADKIRDFASKAENPDNRGIINSVLKQADDFESRGMIPLREVQRLAKGYKWDDRDPATQSIGKVFKNKINRILSDEVEDGVSRAQRSIQDPKLNKLANEYKTVKNKFHHLMGADESIEKLVAREEKNRLISASDYGTGGIGAGLGFAMGGPAGAAIGATTGAVVNKTLRERGNATLAVGADGIADMLQRAPQRFGKFRPIIEGAAKKSPAAAGAAHFILYKNKPEYRELLDASEDTLEPLVD